MAGSTKIFDINFSELEKIFGVVATPIVLVELSSEQIVFLNHAAEELTGYAFDAQNPLLFASLFSPQYAKVISAIVELAKNQSDSFSARENEIEVRRKTGRACPINLSAAPMTWARERCLVITLEDLSAAKRNEKERQQLLEKSVHDAKLIDIGRLAAGMAHELNNPLAILLGYSENLEALITSGEFTGELLRKNLLPMRKSALRMSKIVSKMMANIRDQRAKMDVQSLKQVVRETLTILEDVIAAQSIQLRMEIQDHYVSCDSSQIEQIVTNIVMNAFNALEDRKEGREICIKSFVKGTMTVLEIWNNGAPIPEHVQPQLFTPFFTTKKPGEGTGLGLYMSFNIMKAHSGTLSFKSSEAFGTSFYLSFPLAEKSTLAVPVKKLNLLIVDEDIFFRKLIKQKLIGLEVECGEAHDGEEALGLLAQATPVFDLVLVNYHTPKMSGIEFIAAGRSQYPEVHFSLISEAALSAEQIQELTDLKIDEVLLKPLRSVELADLLEKVRKNSGKKESA